MPTTFTSLLESLGFIVDTSEHPIRIRDEFTGRVWGILSDEDLISIADQLSQIAALTKE